MTTETVKQKILKAVDGLPEEVGFEQVIERIHLLYKIEKGLKQADAGQTFSNEKAEQRMSKWL